MNERQYRQGDVLLAQVDRLPENALRQEPDGSRVVLAYGEVTGHAHAVEVCYATMYRQGDKDFLRVQQGAVLRHEEHAPLTLEPGIYRVVRQREYEHQGWRRVAD